MTEQVATRFRIKKVRKESKRGGSINQYKTQNEKYNKEYLDAYSMKDTSEVQITHLVYLQVPETALTT